MQPEKTKAKLYTRYPLSSILIYNGNVILYFLPDLEWIQE